MIRAVIFDMDGLLIDTEPEWQKMESAFLRKMKIKVNPEMQKRTLGLRSNEMIRFWYNLKPWPDPDFNKTGKEFDESMQEYYLHDAKLMDGASEILGFFKMKKITMALASSSPLFLMETFVKRFEFDHYFRIIHSAEHEEYGKPHPAVYISTAKKLGVAASECLTFEDSFNGLLSAKSALMKAVAVPAAPHYGEARFCIADMTLKCLKDFGEAEFKLLSGI